MEQASHQMDGAGISYQCNIGDNKMKYRIKAYDPINDIYILQKKVFFIFWANVSAGSKKQLETWIKENS